MQAAMVLSKEANRSYGVPVTPSPSLKKSSSFLTAHSAKLHYSELISLWLSAALLLGWGRSGRGFGGIAGRALVPAG